MRSIADTCGELRDPQNEGKCLAVYSIVLFSHIRSPCLSILLSILKDILFEQAEKIEQLRSEKTQGMKRRPAKECFNKKNRRE